HERRFGTQADRARAQDDAPRDSRWVAGVRLWF
ncbi:copper resistance protein B, partial [Xanthomonas sp. Kuri4-3]